MLYGVFRRQRVKNKHRKVRKEIKKTYLIALIMAIRKKDMCMVAVGRSRTFFVNSYIKFFPPFCRNKRLFSYTKSNQTHHFT